MKTALIIEPDKIFKENLSEILELEGFKVRSVTTVFEAETALKESRPSVIICNEASIRESPPKLRDNLKKAHEHSFILILNSDGMDEYYKDADSYLKMPFAYNELFSKLNSLPLKKKP